MITVAVVVVALNNKIIFFLGVSLLLQRALKLLMENTTRMVTVKS